MDIASLFIASTDRYASNSLELVEYINEGNEEFKDFNEVEFQVDNKNSKLIVKTHQFKPTKKDIAFEVKKSDAEYIEIYKLHLKKIEFR